MTHRIMVNNHNKPMHHPITKQVIMPGQSYAEPTDSEQLELVDPADLGLLVQRIADPEATKKARVAVKSNKPGDK